MIDAKLVVVGGDAKRTEVRLKQLPTVIGRGREANLTLPHPLVSRQHCELFERGGNLFVRDLNSTNGTFVDNQKISGEQLLEPNQLLTLGNVTFRAVYEPKLSDTPNDGALDTLDAGAESSSPRSLESASSAESTESEIEFVPENDTDESTFQPPQPRGNEEFVRSTNPKPQPRPEVKTEPVPAGESPHGELSQNQTDDDRNGSDTDTGLSSVLASDESAACGTSQIESEIHIVIEDDEAPVGPERSISVSALDELPPADPAASRIEPLELDGASPDPEPVESIELQLEEESPPDPASASELGSFFKKLPR